MDETVLIRVENKTFGPTDVVALDGNHFIGCTFDGCEVSYSGGDFANEGTSVGRPCNLTFHEAAHRTTEVLRWFGFKIMNYLGKEPETKLPN
jgi:hypothetical protein